MAIAALKGLLLTFPRIDLVCLCSLKIFFIAGGQTIRRLPVTGTAS
jgi:hypothetical protein